MDDKNNNKAPDKTKALALYRAGKSIAQIASELSISRQTLYSWRKRDDWDLSDQYKLDSYQAMLCEYDARIMELLKKPKRSEEDLRELEVLGRERRKHSMSQAKLDLWIAQQAHAKQEPAPIAEGELNPKLKNRGRKKNTVKNHLTDEQIDALEAAFEAEMYEYQRIWYENRHHRIRNILKSRQIGATFHFAREAIVDALRNRRNKVFLSASKGQSLIFSDYIKAFVYRVTGVELKGTDKIIFPDGVRLLFASTSANTAQGYNGDVYGDEYFWIPKYSKFNKVTRAMASQKKWRLTYFSTPSSTTSEAYPFWTGEHINKGRKKQDRVQIDISHKALKDGRLCEDGQWRQIVTIEDAIAKGADNDHDIDILKQEYSPDEFKQLFLCEFVDDSNSTFKFEQLQHCLIDTEKWKDVDYDEYCPVGNDPVWIGFDPSRSIDAASCVVIAPPLKARGKFRIIEKFMWYSESFEYQADQIEDLTKRYNVQQIGIDTTGLGYGVVELVRKFFPHVTPIHYSLETKNAMVTKTKDVIKQKRLQFSTEFVDVVQAFMMIYKTTTDNGQITYKSRRSSTTGHADVAWAVMHALQFESFTGEEMMGETMVKVYR